MPGPARAQDPRGQVVITRFECRTLANLVTVLLLHIRIKRAVRRVAAGFLGATPVVLWRSRTVLSVTLWTDLESIYAMGGVDRHITAARAPSKLGIATSSGIYPFGGDWKNLLFGAAVAEFDPLHHARGRAPAAAPAPSTHER